MYDFAHCLSDYIERHHAQHLHARIRGAPPALRLDPDPPRPARPLPHQYEFARLSVGYTVMSKRKADAACERKTRHRLGRPRMPTISGIRRRGVTAEALRAFAYNIGITNITALTDVACSNTPSART